MFSQLPCVSINNILVFKMTDFQSESKAVVDRIAEYCKPDKIILFGSLSRSKGRDASDIDLLIIKDSDKKRPFRIKEIFEAVRGMDRNYPLDPIVYTQEEIDERLALGDYFIKEIIEEGRVMYEPKS